MLDNLGNSIGTIERDKAHLEGIWHPVSSFLFYSQEGEEIFFYFAKRSFKKSTFPGKLEFTASGHVTIKDKAEDIYREVFEELGLNLPPERFSLVGQLPLALEYETLNATFNIREFYNIYLVNFSPAGGKLKLDFEEIDSLYKINWRDLDALLSNRSTSLKATKLNFQDYDFNIITTLERGDFMPYPDEFGKALLEKLEPFVISLLNS